MLWVVMLWCCDGVSSGWWIGRPKPSVGSFLQPETRLRHAASQANSRSWPPNHSSPALWAKQHLEDTTFTGRVNCINSRAALICPWNLPSCHSTCNRGFLATGPELLCKRVNGTCHNGWQQGTYWLIKGSYEGYFSSPSLALDKQCRTCSAEKKPSIYPTWDSG